MRLANPHRLVWVAAPMLLLAAFVIAPTIVGRGTQAVLLTLLIYASMAQAWNLIGGFGGQLSLGHGAQLGVGAYTCALLILKTEVPVAAAMGLAGLATAAFAMLTSAALLRLSGVYFAIATLAIALAAQAWMVTWEFAGASRGLNLPISGLPEPLVLYYIALGLTVAVSLAAWWLSWSAFGLRLMAVRDDEAAARALGVNGTRVKVLVSTLSGFFVGLIGALVAFNQIALVPENLFDLRWGTTMVVMALIGGSGTVAGPLVGAGVIYYLIEKQFENQPEISPLLAGVLVVAVIRFAPGGVWGVVVRMVRPLWRPSTR